MKIGILTIIDNDNYGNRLQNYATNYVLNKLGPDINVDTFINEVDFNSKRKCIEKTIKKYIKKIIFFNKKTHESERYKNFCEFNKNIKFATKKINAFSKIKDYDYVLVGSDQVWNPTFYRLTTEVDLLGFVAPNKRIAFAASFGVNYIPEKIKKRVGKALKMFKAISVREDAGKEIVKDISNRSDVDVLVDPTMLLSADEWDKVAKKPTMLKCKKYILNYFLGNLSEKRRNEIKRVAEENECEIIDILNKESPFYNCGPSEFLYLEKNAFLVCTDSFHSSVFAILYNRPFVVFDREDNMESMSSRIDTLIHKFKLKDRKYKGKLLRENLNHDYMEAYEILDDERKKSYKFLKNALEIW